MAWPVWLRRRRRPPTASAEAEQAKAKANAALAEARRRRHRVDRVTGYLAEQGSRNHWSERLGEAWRGVPDN